MSVCEGKEGRGGQQVKEGGGVSALHMAPY